MNISLRLLAKFGFPFALVLFCGVCIAGLSRKKELTAAYRVAQNTQDVLIRLESLLFTTIDSEKAVRGFVVTGDEQFLEPYEAAARRIDAETAGLRLAFHDSSQGRRLDSVLSLVDERLSIERNTIDLRKRLGFEAAEREIATRRGKTIQIEIRKIITEMEEEEKRSLAQEEARDSRIAGWTGGFIVSASLLAFGTIALALVSAVRDLRVQQHVREKGLAEQSRRESDRNLRNILDGISTFVGLLSTDGTIVEVNRAPLDVAGLNREDVIGKQAPDTHWFSHSLEAQDRVRNAIKRAAHGETVRYDDTIRVAADQRISIAVTFNPIRDEDGTITQVVGAAVDITDRKHAEELQRASEEQLQLFIDRAPAALAMFDREMRYLRASRRWYDDYGLGDRDLRGLSHYEVFPEIPPQWKRALERGLQGEVLSGEDAFQRAGGHVQWLRWQIHPWTDRSGVIGGIVIFSEDITEMKRASLALEESGAELRSIVENAPYAIYRTTVEKGGRFIYANPAMVKMLGYNSAQEVLGLNLERDVYFDVQDRTRIIEAMRSQGEYRDLEIRWQRKDGKELTIRSSGRLMRSEDGREYFESIAEDVSERRLLERQLRQAQKMEAIGRLAGGIAHDYNNILHVISGYSEIAKDKVAAEHPVANYLLQIKAAADKATRLTRQLLMFSRQQVVFPKVVDLNAVVSNILQMLNRAIGEDIQLSFNSEPNLSTILADVGQLEQVLMNLVVNARDAMPGGGEIIISTQNADLDESYQTLHSPVSPGSYVMLSVSDTGTGMDEITKSHLFEPFFTTKEPGKGSGLGLSTVYGIVKQSGGYIWVYSEVGHGATFKIYFPQVSGPIEKLEGFAEPELVGGTETILLVEDESTFRKVTRELLETAGYAVLEAATAEQAIKIAQEESRAIHLALMDIIMPGIGGVELSLDLRMLRPTLSMVFMSGYAGDALAKQIHLVPDLVLLEKPFSRSSLLTTIRRVLRGRPVSRRTLDDYREPPNGAYEI